MKRFRGGLVFKVLRLERRQPPIAGYFINADSPFYITRAMISLCYTPLSVAPRDAPRRYPRETCESQLPVKRDWCFITEQPAPAPHLAHPERCADLRIVLVTVPRVSCHRSLTTEFIEEDSSLCLTRATSRNMIGVCHSPLSLAPRDAPRRYPRETCESLLPVK